MLSGNGVEHSAGDKTSLIAARPCPLLDWRMPPPAQPPSPEDFTPADSENNTPEAPATRPAPLREREDKSDLGCLLFLLAGFIGIFFIPAIFLLGGAPLIIPLVFLMLFAVVTPVINPAEKMPGRAKWIGRTVIFLTFAALLAAGGWWWFIHTGEAVIRE